MWRGQEESAASPPRKFFFLPFFSAMAHVFFQQWVSSEAQRASLGWRGAAGASAQDTHTDLWVSGTVQVCAPRGNWSPARTVSVLGRREVIIPLTLSIVWLSAWRSDAELVRSVPSSSWAGPLLLLLQQLRCWERSHRLRTSHAPSLTYDGRRENALHRPLASAEAHVHRYYCADLEVRSCFFCVTVAFLCSSNGLQLTQ